jgi:hypothetical protein
MEFPRTNTRVETKEIIANMTAAGDKGLRDEAMLVAGKKMHKG